MRTRSFRTSESGRTARFAWTRPSVAPYGVGENEMADKKQRTLAHTIMRESYSVGIELDADLGGVYRRLASRLKLILAGTECQPASGCPRCPPGPTGSNCP